MIPFRECWNGVRGGFEKLFNRYGAWIIVGEPPAEPGASGDLWGDFGDEDAIDPDDSVWGDLDSPGDGPTTNPEGAVEWLVAVPCRHEFKIDHGLRLKEPAVAVLSDKAPVWANVGATCSWDGRVYRITRVIPWGRLPDGRPVLSVFVCGEEIGDGHETRSGT